MGLADIEITNMMNGTFALESGGQPFAFCDDKDHAETIKKALERCAQDLTAFACVVDCDDHRDIMAAVERRKAWDCEPYESDSCEIGGMIAEICRGWLERVDHDTAQSTRSFVGETSHDSECIGRALAKWREKNPDAKIDHAATLADILADWMDRVEREQQSTPRRTDNGDGTVTFSGVPVTLRTKFVGGRDVLAVRLPNQDDMYVDNDNLILTAKTNWSKTRPDSSPRVIVGPKPQQPEQELHFRTGGFYRDADGVLHGPLCVVRWNDATWSWMDEHDRTWHPDGRKNNAASDLYRGEIIVWRHPGLRAGTYHWQQCVLKCDGDTVVGSLSARYIGSWTDPPRPGKWLVRDGQEYATWDGE